MKEMIDYISSIDISMIFIMGYVNLQKFIELCLLLFFTLY